MKKSIVTFGHIYHLSLLSNLLLLALCASALKGHIAHSDLTISFTRRGLPALPGSCCHCNLSTRLRELWIRPCRLEPCSMVLNSSKGSQQLQPSTSATWRGIKALAVAGLKAFLLPSNAELGVPRSRESVRKIQGFQYSLANNKILWVARTSKQTEITSSYKKERTFSCS